MAPTTKQVTVGDWPRLTRFYGITPMELARLPRWLLRLYAEQMEEILAGEMLAGLTVSSFPYMDESARDRTERQLRRSAGLDVAAVQQVDPLSEEGTAALAGLGIKVVVDSSGSSDA